MPGARCRRPMPATLTTPTRKPCGCWAPVRQRPRRRGGAGRWWRVPRLLAYLRDGTVDPLTQRSVDALRATVPAAEWDEFVSQLEILSVNSTILEFLTNKAFRTVLQVSAPIYDEHFVATSSSSRRQLQQASEDTDQQTLTQLGEEFATVMAGLLLSGGSLVWGCAAVTPIVCAGAILTGYLLYSLFWDTAEAADLPPGTSGGHATGLVELADRVAPCDAQGCEEPPEPPPDPAVRTHCVDVENLKAPSIASFDWREWRWDFVNHCGEYVNVHWYTRHSTIEWSGHAWGIDVGERDNRWGLWSQPSDPPNPITVWCAWVGTSIDPCYRENDYITNPTNWREMHY